MAKGKLFVPLDVNFPDDDKIEAVGLDGAGLYAMSLCLAKRLLEDGRLTRLKLRKLGADDALIDRLVHAGLYTALADDAVRITAWLGHNEPAESVLSSDKAKRLAHQRHHVNDGKFSSKCRFCVEEEPQVNAEGCGEDAERIESHCVDALLETDTETDTTPSKSQDYSRPDPQTLAKAAALVARQIASTDATTNPAGLAAAIATRINNLDAPDDDRDRIVAALAAGQTPEEIAAGWEAAKPDWLTYGGSARTEPTAPRPPLRPFSLAAHEAEAEAQRAILEAQAAS